MARVAEFLSLAGLQLAVGLVALIALRLALGACWRRPAYGRVAVVILGADLGLPLAWFIGARGVAPQLADGLVPLLMALFILQGALAVVAALLALRHAAQRLAPRTGTPVDRQGRRRLLRATAVAVPAAALSIGGAGAVEAQQVARLRRRRLVLPQLPAALDGLRILQISDVHLWYLVHLRDLSAALDQVAPGEMDLVCVTGDLADDFTQLPAALRRIAALAPPLGCFACLGNHEWARGIEKALALFAAGPVPLLQTDGRRLRHNGQDVHLLAIDDPRSDVHAPRGVFFRDQVTRVMQSVSPGSFTILMSHRPMAFDEAARHGVDLTLAGHTHGGQAAFLGHSILELTSPEKYPWGVYRQGSSVLHVTCGLGQWFPFRLGCPPELVMLELRRT